MSENIPSELINSLSERTCVLFAGAGLSIKYGGCSWGELVNYLIDKYNYSSPLTKVEEGKRDSFRIIEDIMEKNTPNSVYEEVQKKFSNISLRDPAAKLTKIPWFTAFTTNYDEALENSLKENLKLSIRVVTSGNEFNLTGIPSQMLCVKLMGSVEKGYNQDGSMVLTSADFARAEDERVKIFNLLKDHAANLTFLIVGYSFNDGIILKIIDSLKSVVGTNHKKFYALFKDDPDESVSYILSQNNVEIIKMDIDEFSEKLYNEFQRIDPLSYIYKKISVGNDIVIIDPTKISNFLSFHSPVLHNQLREDVSPDAFFWGKTNSLKPFGLKWHYERNEINNVVNAIIKNETKDNKSKFICVEGNIGTGRTFVILAAIYNLITNNRSIAIKIPNYLTYSIPDYRQLEGFINEVEDKLKENKFDGIRRIIFWCESTPDPKIIYQFNTLISNYTDYPLFLIFEYIKDSGVYEGIFPENMFVKIDVDKKISDGEKDKLTNYLINTTKVHRFPETNKKEVESIIKTEETLLPIMYKLIDPSRRSINDLIDQGFNDIKDADIKNCIALCALASSYNIEVPISILLKSMRSISKKQTYPEIFELAHKGSSFLKFYMDERTIYYFSIYHQLVAQRISGTIGVRENDNSVLLFAKSIDNLDPTETDFISNLLINIGVNKKYFGPQLFSDDGIERALIYLKDKTRSRLILHHLARFYEYKNSNDEKIIPLLMDSLAPAKVDDCFEERKENVLTSLANVEWKQMKDRLVKENINNPEVRKIFSLLQQAREGTDINVHSYDVQARILYDMAQNKTGAELLSIINMAYELLIEGLSYCINDEENTKIFNQHISDFLYLDSAETAELNAISLFKEKNDGIGYYTLAIIEHRNFHYPKSMEYINKALSAKFYPPAAIAFKIELLLTVEDKNGPNYKELEYLADLLNQKGYKDNWRSYYHKGAIYLIVGRSDEAVKCFYESAKKAPRTLYRDVEIFWLDKNNRRKMFLGKIVSMKGRDGFIISRQLAGWTKEIYFNPIVQEYRDTLEKGELVYFELGFSPRGPQAFDVRSQKHIERRMKK